MVVRVNAGKDTTFALLLMYAYSAALPNSSITLMSIDSLVSSDVVNK